jgi:succinyl-diaminopimelate desuccinylase
MADLESIVDRVLEAVDDAYAIDLACRLVRTPSVYRPGDPSANESAVAALLAAELRRLGLDVTVEPAAPGRPNVVADWVGGAPGPLVILEGHSDVVTEGDPAAWSVPPFAGAIVDRRLYGRGAADMKGGVAAAVAAVRAVRDAGAPLCGRIRLAVVADEEGMMAGIKTFIRNGWARGACGAIVCEPEANQVCLVQKGALRAVGRFTGKMAHGAMPKAGANPVPAAAEFVRELGRVERRYVERHGAHPLLGEPSVTPTAVRAGDLDQLNVVPAEAAIAIDVRTIPGQDPGGIRRDLQAALERAQAAVAGCRATLEILEERPWTETPEGAAIVEAVDRACRRVQGRAPGRAGVPGATDGTFLSAWAGVPTVTIGPGDVMVPHQVDEFVRVVELVEAARLFAASVCYCLGPAA